VAKVSRTRVIPVGIERVWDLVSDPHSLPRWWPRTRRVEDVRGAGKRARWTQALETDRGATVRADFRCVAAEHRRRYAWEQEIEGTPFERILRSSSVEVQLAPEDGSTEVTLIAREATRGLARLGTTMLRSAAKSRLDEALEGIERALVAE
jgi:uncharacterized protein YndB with AHSA1/START domain